MLMFIGRPTRSSQILTSTGMSVYLPLVHFFICVWGGSRYVCAITHVSVDNLECHSSPTLLRLFLICHCAHQAGFSTRRSSESKPSHQAWQQASLPRSHLMCSRINLCPHMQTCTYFSEAESNPAAPWSTNG